MTAIMNLRAFMSDRLSSAAMEIFEEVERIITAYQTEVSRSREEVGYLKKQLELLRDAEHPEINEGSSIDPQQVNMCPTAAIKREERSVRSMDYEDSAHPQANVDSTHANSKIQTDIAMIKEEKEVLCIDSEGLERVITASFVQRDADQAETELIPTYESLAFPSIYSAAVNSDLDDWSKQTKSGKEQVLVVQREINGLNQGLTLVAHEGPSTKNQSDHSFCHLCGKPFRYIGSLMKHIKMHDDRTVNCGVCNKPCHNIENLISHLRCAHRDTHFCHICGKTFSKQCFLIIHSKQHKGVKPVT